jgi:hypothetical protein
MANIERATMCPVPLLAQCPFMQRTKRHDRMADRRVTLRHLKYNPPNIRVEESHEHGNGAVLKYIETPPFI